MELVERRAFTGCDESASLEYSSLEIIFVSRPASWNEKFYSFFDSTNLVYHDRGVTKILIVAIFSEHFFLVFYVTNISAI
jgi:hypothetical protein